MARQKVFSKTISISLTEEDLRAFFGVLTVFASIFLALRGQWGPATYCFAWVLFLKQN